MKLSDIKVDPQRVEVGAWIDKIPSMGDLRLRVRGINNRDYRRLQSELVAATPRAKRNDPDEQDRITATLLLETVLTDWSGVLGDDEKPVPYSKEMAQQLLSDPAYVAFRGAVVWAATVVGEEQAEELEEDAKNSPRRSAGRSPGAPSKSGS